MGINSVARAATARVRGSSYMRIRQLKAGSSVGSSSVARRCCGNTVHIVQDQKNQQDTDGRLEDDTGDAIDLREDAVHDTVQCQPVDMAEDMSSLEGLDGLDDRSQKPSAPAQSRYVI